MALKLVPKIELTPKEAIVERLKKRVRPDGVLQCNRCGSRSSITVVAGAAIKSGRVQGGTVTAKHECAECWRRGIFSPMLPELKPVKDSK